MLRVGSENWSKQNLGVQKGTINLCAAEHSKN
jgi:hypothetical protein